MKFLNVAAAGQDQTPQVGGFYLAAFSTLEAAAVNLGAKGQENAANALLEVRNSYNSAPTASQPQPQPRA